MTVNGTSTVSASPEAGGASARGGLYKVFSLAFRYPSLEIVAFFGDPELPEALAQLPAQEEGALVSELAAYLRSSAFREDIARVESAYHALFHLEGGVPLYESAYRSAHEFQWAETLADVNGFYRAFGLELVGERPDHLSAELEFMYVLALKEVCARFEADGKASREHLQITWEAERAFLRDHLAVWVPAFARALRRRMAKGGRFYKRMSAWLDRFLQGECARFGVSPSATAVSPTLSEAEEELACPVSAASGGAVADRSSAWGDGLGRWEIPEEGEEER